MNLGMTAVFSQREGLAFDDALAEARNITAGELVPQALQAWYDGSEEAFRAFLMEKGLSL